jgi:hypothetical protein
VHFKDSESLRRTHPGAAENLALVAAPITQFSEKAIEAFSDMEMTSTPKGVVETHTNVFLSSYVDEATGDICPALPSKASVQSGFLRHDAPMCRFNSKKPLSGQEHVVGMGSCGQLIVTSRGALWAHVYADDKTNVAVRVPTETPPFSGFKQKWMTHDGQEVNE